MDKEGCNCKGESAW